MNLTIILRRIVPSLALLLPAAASAQEPIYPTAHGYPRLQRIAPGVILAAATSFPTKTISVFESRDDGASFAVVGRIADPEFGQGLCCGTIFRLPRAIGTLAAGTILWAGSVGQDAPDRRMSVKVYASTDNGRHWAFRSSIRSSNRKGLWEPEFTLANDGALVMIYSDETDGVHSQKLVETRSYDGTTWVDTTDVVASADPRDRPGMAFVSRLADGRRFMTYEICHRQCAAYHRLSPDGWNWGSPGNLGGPIRLVDGSYPAHAPTNQIMPDGTLLVVGQVVMTEDNAIAPDSGTVLFASRNGDPAGPWTTVPAPVAVPATQVKPCVNYSSALLPLDGGRRLLELAGRAETDGRCRLYAGRLGWPPSEHWGSACPIARHVREAALLRTSFQSKGAVGDRSMTAPVAGSCRIRTWKISASTI